MAKVIEVIETFERRGLGTENNPVRKIYQLWTLDGKLIFAKDPSPEEGSMTNEEINARENGEVGNN